jgi:hypothetical protein
MDEQELKQTLTQLQQQQNSLLEELRNSSREKKDSWDKIQCVAPILSGLLIGGFGAFIGYSYNQQQIKLLEAETIERFIPHLAGNEKTKKAAILAMSSLTNAELAIKMASLFASEGTVSALESIAQTGDSKDRTVASTALAKAFNSMAQKSLDENSVDQAALYLRKALAIKETLDGPDSSDLCSSLDKLAELYVSQGKLALAEPLFRRSLNIKQKTVGQEAPVTVQSMRRLADLLEQRGDIAEAAALKRQSQQATNPSLAQDPLTAEASNNSKEGGEDHLEAKPAEEQVQTELDNIKPSEHSESNKNSINETDSGESPNEPGKQS